MIRGHVVAAVIAAGAALAAPSARAESLIVSLSSHHVRITQTYTGAELVIFGVIQRGGSIARQGPYDVVVTASGPRGMMVVREKVRMGPVWANLEQRKFGALPVTLAVLSTRPVAEITTPALRQRYGLGLDALIPRPGAGLADDDDDFRSALIRLRGEAGLYVERGDAVTFVSPEVFRAPVPVPSTAPVGTYEVSIALLADGVQIARETTNFEVSKAGFEQALYLAARDRPFAYGAFTAFVALTVGWLASVIFRRD